MNEEQKQLSEEDEQSVLEQFCSQLKVARETKGLTIKSVATDLRLNSELIQALENNDMDKLPSKIFVMGYLRSYARYLGVDESGLKQLDLSELHQTVDMKASFSEKTEKTSKAFSIRIMTYLVTIGMVALLAVWWISKQPSLTEISSVESYLSHDTDNALNLPDKTTESVIELNSSEISDSAPDEPVTASGAAIEPTVTPEKDVIETEPTVYETVVSENNSPEVIAEPVAQSELNITYLEDSWTEVSDASGDRLLYGLYKKGREVTVQGVAPFSLFFGYASGVVVTHNEEQFDHAAFHRNGMARFKVGTAEDNHLPNEH
ncbi:MAG: DUF4115 domain-containing protein [Chromatiales bacterium]|nr:DUF4115 domain-containing protein [Chromatiales bacterium]